MGATNDKRVSRYPNIAPDYSRDDNVKAALDALFEEDTGKGYSEVAYINNVFASTIETYTDGTKTELRSKTTFDYPSGPFQPFISMITKEFFRDGSGTAFFTVVGTLNYNANKTVNTIDIVVTRL